VAELKALAHRAKAIGVELELTDEGVKVSTGGQATDPLPYNKDTLQKLREGISTLEPKLTA